MSKASLLLVFFTTNLFYAISILGFTHKVLGETRFKKKLISIGFTAFYLAYVLMYCFATGYYGTILSFLEVILPLGLVFCYKAPLKKQLWIVVSIIVISIITQLAANLLISLIANDSLHQFTTHKANMLGIISRLLFFCITQIFAGVLAKSKELPTSYWVCVMIFPVGSIPLVQVLYGLVVNTKQYAIVLLCIIIILIMNILVFYLYGRLAIRFADKAHQALLEQQVSYYLKQSEDIALAWDEKLRLMHDQKHQLLAINTYLSQGDYHTLTHFVNELLIGQDIDASTIGNPILSAIISYKIMQANKHGIAVESNICVPVDLKVNAEDFCILLGNALDNATQAAMTAKTKKIQLNMQYQNDNMLLIIQNPYAQKLSRNEAGELLSTKGAQHGFGMKSIQRVVDKYGGMLSINDNENLFTLKIVLYDL